MSTERDELAADIRGLGITVIDGPPVDLSEPLAQHLHNLGYRKPRTITTEEELESLPQGAKLYSPATTHSWVLNDLSSHGGVKVHGTGGGYTYLRDFILHEAPLVVLHDGSAS